MTSTLPLCHRHFNFVSVTFKKKYQVEEELGIRFSRLSDFDLQHLQLWQANNISNCNCANVLCSLLAF